MKHYDRAREFLNAIPWRVYFPIDEIPDSLFPSVWDLIEANGHDDYSILLGDEATIIKVSNYGQKNI